MQPGAEQEPCPHSQRLRNRGGCRGPWQISDCCLHQLGAEAAMRAAGPVQVTNTPCAALLSITNSILCTSQGSQLCRLNSGTPPYWLLLPCTSSWEVTRQGAGTTTAHLADLPALLGTPGLHHRVFDIRGLLLYVLSSVCLLRGECKSGSWYSISARNRNWFYGCKCHHLSTSR